MICPACGTNNLEGLDACDNCGADLRTVGLPRGAVDSPAPATQFEARVQTALAAVVRRPAEVVPSDTAVTEAIARIRAGGNDCLLVGEAGRVVGIFTERDAVVKLAGLPLQGLTVAETMTRDPVVLRPDDTVAVAIHKMAVGGFRHIPLVDDEGHAAGVVSSTDVFRHVLAV